MKLKLSLIAAFLFAAQGILVNSAMAYSGTQLLDGCNSAIKLMDEERLTDSQVVEAARCMYFISGFYNGYLIGTAKGKAQHPLICEPKPAPTGEQLLRIVTLFARNHPRFLNNGAAVIAGVALAQAFPCSKK